MLCKSLKSALIVPILDAGHANESAGLTEVMSLFRWRAQGPEGGQPLKALSFLASVISVIDHEIYIAFR